MGSECVRMGKRNSLPGPPVLQTAGPQLLPEAPPPSRRGDRRTLVHTGCSTVVLIGITCPAITVGTPTCYSEVEPHCSTEAEELRAPYQV